jgi:hypothetical protein
MDKRLLVAAVAGLMAAPASAVPVQIRRTDDDAPTMFFKNDKPRRLLPELRKGDVSRLQLRAYRKAEIRRDPPSGYFWHQAANGADSWYLLKLPPGAGNKVYDELNDRTINYSGWGYVKPTYAPGDAR